MLTPNHFGRVDHFYYEALQHSIGWLSSVGWFEFEAGADGVGGSCSGGRAIAALSPKTKFIFVAFFTQKPLGGS